MEHCSPLSLLPGFPIWLLSLHVGFPWPKPLNASFVVTAGNHHFLGFSFRVMIAENGINLHFDISGACGSSRIQVKQSVVYFKALQSTSLKQRHPSAPYNLLRPTARFWSVDPLQGPKSAFNRFHLHPPKANSNKMVYKPHFEKHCVQGVWFCELGAISFWGDGGRKLWINWSTTVNSLS